jgi:hypothetical protein
MSYYFKTNVSMKIHMNALRKRCATIEVLCTIINDIDSEELPRAKRFRLKASPAKGTVKTPGAPPEN